MIEEKHVVKKTITMEDIRILDICRDIELLNEQNSIAIFQSSFRKTKNLRCYGEKPPTKKPIMRNSSELAIRHKNEMLASVNIEARTVVTAFKFVQTILEFAKKSPPSVADALQLSVKLEERLSRLHLSVSPILPNNRIKSSSGQSWLARPPSY